jgi:hypothetical protein
MAEVIYVINIFHAYSGKKKKKSKAIFVTGHGGLEGCDVEDPTMCRRGLANLIHLEGQI